MIVAVLSLDVWQASMKSLTFDNKKVKELNLQEYMERRNPFALLGKHPNSYLKVGNSMKKKIESLSRYIDLSS